MYILEVTNSFLDHRQEKSKLYNQRGRSDRKFLMDLDAELFEWYMITTGVWEAHDDWTVDAIRDGQKIDVKFISKYYNLTPTKVCNVLLQRDILDGYLFMGYVTRPQRPLKEGDMVGVEEIGYLTVDELMDGIRPSTNYKDWGTSHYVDVRRLLKAKV